MKVDILILNYNGKALMQKFLPSVVKAAGHSRHMCNVMVVDNLSTDGSVEFLKNGFPGVKIFIAEKNEVLYSYNKALGSLDSDIVIFLNNDIEVKEDFIDYLLEHFNRKDIFFAAPRILNLDNSYNGGKSYLKFELGIIKCIVDRDTFMQAGRTNSILAGAFRRDLFLQLGGFDNLYLPGIWEEVDLCYRGLLLGKEGVYEPRSVIWHQESATFKKEYGVKKKLVLAHRNMFLFFWKNVYNKRLIAEHIFYLPLRVFYSILSGRIEFAKGFLFALFKLPLALSRRYRGMKQRRLRKLKDMDIIRLG